MKQIKIKVQQMVSFVICAGTSRAQSTKGSLFQKYVYSTFSGKMVLNCVHIWSVNLFLVEDKVLESWNAATKSWHQANWPSLELLPSAKHARPVGLFLPKSCGVDCARKTCH